MHPTVADRLAERRRARALGDVNLEQACNADLARLGYQDGPETTVEVVEDMERAIPSAPKRGRPKRPRCEHNNIVGRCVACDEMEEL